MQIGVVGKPSVGKSTFFKASTLMDVDIASYPFTTIKPNSGVGFVRVKRVDKEFDVEANPRTGYCAGDWRFVAVDMIDVAGLVPGAHNNEGRGNQFLDDLRQADVLIHVIDVSGSTNAKGEPVDAGSYDPAEDIKFLEFELDQWYLGVFKKVWDKFSRTITQEKQDVAKAIAKQFSGMMLTEDMAKKSIAILNLSEKASEWTPEELLKLVQEFRRLTKPMIIAANKADTPSGQKNIKELHKQFPDLMIVPCSAGSELALKEAAKQGVIDYIPGSKKFALKGDVTPQQENGLAFIQTNVLEIFGSTGVQEVMDKAVFELLGFKAIFPGGVKGFADKDGNVLPDCFLMPGDATPLDFAYRIHSDIGDTYIKAVDVRTKMPIAKDHVLDHRSVIEIMSAK